MSDRSAALLSGLTHHQRLIELGPSHNPLAPRSAGWDTVVIDHDTRAGLVEKYRLDPNVDTSRIEDVDLVWTEGALDGLFPPAEQGRYAALIASHVIEHLPDPLGFLASCARLLDPVEGRVLLAVPDKRWCFDVFRPLTSAGQWFGAHRTHASRHSRETLYDHVAYVAFLDGRGAWGRERMDGLHLAHTIDQAVGMWRALDDSPQAPYVDAHAWQFTPSSFSLLILEAGAAGLCDWHIEWIAPQPGVEFLVRLRRGVEQFATPEAREARRLHLLRETIVELHEHSAWLVPPETPGAVPPTLVARLRRRLRPVRAAWRRLR